MRALPRGPLVGDASIRISRRSGDNSSMRFRKHPVRTDSLCLFLRIWLTPNHRRWRRPLAS